MKSPYNFIISPYGDKYSNTKTINGEEFIVNTSLEIAKYVNRLGIVEALPINYEGDICIGDTVIIHHNVFRVYYDMKGRQTNSPEYFRDGVFIVSPDRIYMYKRNNTQWNPHLNFCFVLPIETIQEEGKLFDIEKEEKHTGYLLYPSKKQEEIGFKKGDLIAFTKNSEYAFEIDEQKLYRMHDRDVVLKLN
jgi:hypothetical protein